MVLDYSQNGITAVFEITEKNTVILRRFAAEDSEALPHRKEPRERWRSIVDVQVTGEDVNDHHGSKHTGTSGVFSLTYACHRYYENEYGNKLEFYLEDGRMGVKVHYQFYREVAAVRAWTTVVNISSEPFGLEYLSSFAYTGFDEGLQNPNDKMLLYIPHSTWRREIDWRVKTLSDCGLEEINDFALNRVNISNTGFWSTKEYLPMGGFTNRENGNTLLWQIESNGSWQWEIGDIGKMLYLKCSGPTEQENHWYKELFPGEAFESVKATVAVGRHFDGALGALTAYRRRIVRLAEPNKALPVIFNDYMHCIWAKPTEEKMLPLIDKAAELGCEYYCMDAGWYAGLDGTWWDRVGEWLPSSERFPHGIKWIFDRIREKGMVPGIWLEPEVMGVQCPLAAEFPDECFIMRHGKRVIDHGRYVLDFRNERVRAHTTDAFRRVIEEFGVGYIKTDYNVEGGIGTELDADSFGDGLLSHCRAFKAWCDEMRERYPDVIIENCASGGMRMDYLMLENRDIQSMTDQENYLHIARIAAMASTAVLPEQAAIWAVPRDTEDSDAAAFNMTSALLQRIHLGGTIAALSDESFALVKEGIECYKAIRGEIPTSVPFYPLGNLSCYGSEFFCSAYRYGDRVRMTVWRLSAKEDTLTISGAYESARILYPSNTLGSVALMENSFTVRLPKTNTAMLLELRPVMH